MSAVQAFLYSHLTGDVVLSNLVGGAIYDAAPAGDLPEIAIIIGAEEVIDVSDAGASARLHRAEVEIIARGPGFLAAKDVAGNIRRVLEAASGPVSNGHVTRTQFRRAQSLRETADGLRRIRMRFDLFFDEQ
ncbi:MAG: DUF3168 domain-containing protein [Pseudomonadota bacterium]